MRCANRRPRACARCWRMRWRRRASRRGWLPPGRRRAPWAWTSPGATPRASGARTTTRWRGWRPSCAAGAWAGMRRWGAATCTWNGWTACWTRRPGSWRGCWPAPSASRMPCCGWRGNSRHVSSRRSCSWRRPARRARCWPGARRPQRRMWRGPGCWGWRWARRRRPPPWPWFAQRSGNRARRWRRWTANGWRRGGGAANATPGPRRCWSACWRAAAWPWRPGATAWRARWGRRCWSRTPRAGWRAPCRCACASACCAFCCHPAPRACSR